MSKLVLLLLLLLNEEPTKNSFNTENKIEVSSFKKQQ